MVYARRWWHNARYKGKQCYSMYMEHMTYLLIAERLSARLLIVQCSQFTLYVCMYVYIYPSHFNCVGTVSVVLSPDY